MYNPAVSELMAGRPLNEASTQLPRPQHSTALGSFSGNRGLRCGGAPTKPGVTRVGPWFAARDLTKGAPAGMGVSVTVRGVFCGQHDGAEGCCFLLLSWHLQQQRSTVDESSHVELLPPSPQGIQEQEEQEASTKAFGKMASRARWRISASDFISCRAAMPLVTHRVRVGDVEGHQIEGDSVTDRGRGAVGIGQHLCLHDTKSRHMECRMREHDSVRQVKYTDSLPPPMHPATCMLCAENAYLGAVLLGAGKIAGGGDDNEIAVGGARQGEAGGGRLVLCLRVGVTSAGHRRRRCRRWHCWRRGRGEGALCR